MKLNNMKKFLAVASVLSFSAPQVFAQSYSGTVDDLNSIFNPPSNIQGTICDYTDSDNVSHSGSACRDGVAAARWMAEKYAKRAGQYLGCIDGLRQGVSEGFDNGKRVDDQVREEAQSYIAGVQMDSALFRAEDRAIRSGQTESANDIISRYREVIGHKDASGRAILPNKAPTPPANTFKGFNDGYEYDIEQGDIRGISFDEVTNKGYVERNSSFEEKVTANAAYDLRTTYTGDLCDVTDTIFGRNSMPQYTLWDYFSQRRIRDFQDYEWKNGGIAFNIFKNDERNLDHYKNYQRIGDKTVTETVPVYTEREEYVLVDGQRVPELDANGQPKKDQYGDIIYKTETVREMTGTKEVTRKLNKTEADRLRAIYRQAFVDSYEIYFAKQYASQEYHQEGQEKYDIGKTIGNLVGKQVANQLAKKSAYNSQYKTVSATRFGEKVEELYMENFNRIMNIFENNAVVEINDLRILDTTDDGIFRRGEEIAAQLTVTNLGEVGNEVKLSLSDTQDIIAYQQGDTMIPNALDITTIDTGVLGRISNDAGLKDRISVALNMDNPGGLNEIQSMLKVSETDGMILRDYAEISDVAVDFNLLDGLLDVNVVLHNAADIESPAMPEVTVRIDGQDLSDTKNTMKIGPQSDTDPLLITFSSIDPMTIIQKGGISGVVISKLGNKTIDRKSFDIRVRDSKESIFARYLDGIATKKITDFSGTTREDRIKEVTDEIERLLDYVLANDKIDWDKQRDVNRTIVGKLIETYQSSQVANLIDADAQEVYDRAAKLLAKRVYNKGRNRIRAGWWFTNLGGKKRYLKILQKFSPSLSTKKKDHK